MLLRQLSVISAKILRESRDLANAGTPILVAFLLEREDVLDAEPAMLAGRAPPSPPRWTIWARCSRRCSHEPVAR